MHQKYSLSESFEEILEHDMTCSFCGETGKNRQYMFQAQDGLCICDDCVLICTEVIETEESSSEEEINLLSLN